VYAKARTGVPLGTSQLRRLWHHWVHAVFACDWSFHRIFIRTAWIAVHTKGRYSLRCRLRAWLLLLMHGSSIHAYHARPSHSCHDPALCRRPQSLALLADSSVFGFGSYLTAFTPSLDRSRY